MAITNVMGLPQPFVDAATSDHRYKEHRYSVTEVLGGTCEAVLKRRHQGEADEDVADRVWAIFGTAVHDVLRRAQGTESQLQENWLSVPVVGDYELSGIFDLYDDSTGTVTDYKTASIWKVKFGDFSDWREQTLAYCWMLRESGFDARRGEIVALLKDHSKRDAILKAGEGYPPHPVYQIAWDFTDEDFEAIEDKIMYWFARVANQERVPDEKLLPCDPAQRWHREDKWAVKKKGRKTAVRVYDNKNDAYQRAAGENRQASKDDLFYVEFREGEDTKCAGYCPVAQFCPHGRKIVGE
jgi:hypothetical protein